MIFFKHNDDEETEFENPEDEEAALADDILDEVGEDVIGEDEIEGFGLIAEEPEKEEAEEAEDGDEEETPLDEDAEDVDFDTFDDVDEM